MVRWYQGTIAAREQAAAGMHRVHIDVAGTPLVGTHTLPGQYLRVRYDQAGEGLFAIASGPATDGRTFELLVKEGSDLADALGRLPLGTRVELTAPEGPGFPLEHARGHRVLLFATGSGISAIRSLIQAICSDRGAFRDVTLYFGARTPDAFAYQGEFAQWQSAGIGVVLTVSQPGHAGWEGLTGYVQSHLPQERLEDAVAFVCGQDEMVRGVKDALHQRGVGQERIFLNV